MSWLNHQLQFRNVAFDTEDNFEITEIHTFLHKYANRLKSKCRWILFTLKCLNSNIPKSTCSRKNRIMLLSSFLDTEWFSCFLLISL